MISNAIVQCIFLRSLKFPLPVKYIVTAVCLPLFYFGSSQKWVSLKAATLWEGKKGIKMYGKSFRAVGIDYFCRNTYINTSFWINIYFFCLTVFLAPFCTMWFCSLQNTHEMKLFQPFYPNLHYCSFEFSFLFYFHWMNTN